MKEIKAAKMLSCWKKNQRATVTVTKADYDELLHGLPVKFCTVLKDNGTVQSVVLDRQQATRFLQSKYQLHDMNHGLRRDSF